MDGREGCRAREVANSEPRMHPSHDGQMHGCMGACILAGRGGVQVSEQSATGMAGMAAGGIRDPLECGYPQIPAWTHRDAEMARSHSSDFIRVI